MQIFTFGVIERKLGENLLALDAILKNIIIFGAIVIKLGENLLARGARLIEANLVPLNFKLKLKRPIFSFRILPLNLSSCQVDFQRMSDHHNHVQCSYITISMVIVVWFSW